MRLALTAVNYLYAYNRISSKVPTSLLAWPGLFVCLLSIRERYWYTHEQPASCRPLAGVLQGSCRAW